jgi:hypothetical protein
VLDYVFKRIFGDPRNGKILAAFLMAVLDLSEAELEGLAIVDSRIRNVRSGNEFTDKLALHILEPRKLPEEPDGEPLG